MKKSKRFRQISVILIFLLVGSILPVGALGQVGEVTGHWAEETMSRWIISGLASGYPDGTFKPDGTITRAEYLTLINKSHGFNDDSDTIDFIDVKEKDWCYQAIASAVKEGYISGYPDRTMKPNAEITRQEVAVIVSKLAKSEASETSSLSFTDAGDVSNWALDGVRYVSTHGFMETYADGSFKPQQYATRAEVITALDRLISRDDVLVPGIPKVIDQPGVYGTDEMVQVNYHVVITVPNVTLQNLTFTKKLTVAESVQEGEVNLNNVNVEGELVLLGGGKDSIHINGGQIRLVIVQEDNMIVRIVTTDGSTVETVSVTGNNTEVLFSGELQNMFMEADNILLRILSGSTVENTTVLANSNGGIVIIDMRADVGQMNVEGNLSQINNQGTIDFIVGDGFGVDTGFGADIGLFTGIPPNNYGERPFVPPPPPPPSIGSRPPSFGGGGVGEFVPPPSPPPITPPPLLSPELSVTVEPEGYGTVTGAGTHVAGTSVTLTATPLDGKEFVKWVKEDNTEVTDNPLVVTMPLVPTTYKAVFRNEMIPIEGTVSLVGDARYGGTLELDIDITSPEDVDASQLDIAWFRGFLQPITSTTETTYVLTEDDIGQEISVWVSGDGITLSGMLATQPVTVGKAPNNSVPNQVENWTTTDTTIEFTPENDVEYQLMKGENKIHDWQLGGLFSGLEYITEYQVYARYQETATHEASAEEEVLQALTDYSIVTSVDNPNIVVPYGASENDVWNYIPNTLTVRHGIEGVSECDAQWDMGNFSSTQPGVHVVLATLTLPSGVLTDGGDTVLEQNVEIIVNEQALVSAGSFEVAEGQTYGGQFITCGIDCMLVTEPEKGTLTFNNAGVFSYNAHRQPTSGFVSSDSFVFGSNSGSGDLYIADITIIEDNDAPTVNGGSVEVFRTTAYNGQIEATDVDGDALIYTIVSNPTQGHLTLYDDGSFMYIWTSASVAGTMDAFSFKVNDGLIDSNTEVITLVLQNSPPVANDETVIVNEDSTVLVDVLVNDSDLDGDTLAISSFTQGANGTVIQEGDSIRYTPNPNFNGADSFTYEIHDYDTGTATATVNITVNPVNDIPVASNDNVTTYNNTSILIDVLANDTDVDGDNLIISGYTQGYNRGVVSQEGNKLRYTPDTDFVGNDAFQYEISDGSGGFSAATVNVTVNSENSLP